jgi:hypothetical protein
MKSWKTLRSVCARRYRRSSRGDDFHGIEARCGGACSNPRLPSDLEAQSLVALMLIHSWYDDKCCHDKDCRPVPCEEIEKISDGWLWRDRATEQRHWFPHDRLKASHDDACHVCVSPQTIPSGICIYLPLPA